MPNSKRRESNYPLEPWQVKGSRSLAVTTAMWLMLCGCQTGSAARFEQHATRTGLTSAWLEGAGYRHRIFTNEKARSTVGGVLHVYFSSDGSPYRRNRYVVKDPTPRTPLTLDLMAQDSQAAVLVGRPCYHRVIQRAATEACSPEIWTIGRYSETVVASMAAAVEQLVTNHQPDAVVLIGYSGGGTLAVLIAGRLTRVDAVMTLAANLDVDAWTTWHGYEPLRTSLNPARDAESRPGVRELHLHGAADANVPPQLNKAYLERVPQAEVRVLEEFDHTCCWPPHWAIWLSEMDTELVSREPSVNRQ